MKIQAVAAALIIRQAQVLLAQRQPHKLEGGSWEFPGGKVEENETPQEALKRELQEELGIVCLKFEECWCLPIVLTTQILHLHLYEVISFLGEPQGCEGQALQWVPFSRIYEIVIPTANKPIIELLLQKYTL